MLLLGGDGNRLVASGRGTEVSVVETTGGGTGPELAGGKPVAFGSGCVVFEGTPVLIGGPILENPSVVLGGITTEKGILFVPLGGGTLSVDEGVLLVLVSVVGGGTALELPLSGVTMQVLSSLTISTPFTTIGVRVIVHV